MAGNELWCTILRLGALFCPNGPAGLFPLAYWIQRRNECVGSEAEKLDRVLNSSWIRCNININLYLSYSIQRGVCVWVDIWLRRSVEHCTVYRPLVSQLMDSVKTPGQAFRGARCHVGLSGGRSVGTVVGRGVRALQVALIAADDFLQNPPSLRLSWSIYVTWKNSLLALVYFVFLPSIMRTCLVWN